MKTVVIEGKDLLFTLFKLAFYIWIEMWNVRILLVSGYLGTNRTRCLQLLWGAPVRRFG